MRIYIDTKERNKEGRQKGLNRYKDNVLLSKLGAVLTNTLQSGDDEAEESIQGRPTGRSCCAPGHRH